MASKGEGNGPSKRDKVWVAALSVIAVAVTAFAFSPILPGKFRIPSRFNSRGYEVIKQGSCEAIAVVKVVDDSRDLPKEVGGKNGWFHREAMPLVFFLTVPPGTRPNASLILPEGREVLATIEQGFTNPQAAAVEIPQHYPPTLSHVDVKVVIPGGGTSIWRVTPLPPPVEVLPTLSKPSSIARGSGVQVSGAAWARDSGGATVPLLFSAVQAKGNFAKGEFWEMRNVATQLPFASSHRPTSTGTTGWTIGPGSSKQSTGLYQGSPFASHLPSVRLTGSVERFQVLVEWLDLGEVDLVPTRTGAPDNYMLSLPSPRTLATPSGLRLTFLPLRTLNSSHSGRDGYLYLRVAIDAATLRQGLPTKMAALQPGSTPLVEIQPMGGEYYTGLQRPERMPEDSHPNLVLNMKGLRKGKFRLKLLVRRRLADRRLPFDLRVPVQHPQLKKTPAPRVTDYTSTGVFSLSPEEETLLPK